MIKLKKLGAAAVFSLLLSMAIFATGAFAQSAQQNGAHSKISVSARAAVINTVARGVAAKTLHAYGWGGGDDWDGGCGWDGCHDGFSGFAHPITRCTSTRVCQSIRVCHWSAFGRICRSERICRSIRRCELCRTGFGFGGFDGAFAVKKSLGR